MENGHGRPIEELRPFQPLTLKMRVKALKDVETHFGFAILRNDDLLCFCALTSLDSMKTYRLRAGETIEVENKIKKFSLLDGTYKVIGGILDDSGLHIYHHVDSRPIRVKSPRQIMGLVDFERAWKIGPDNT